MTGLRAAGTLRAFARFLAVGLANTLATYALYLLLLHWLGYRTSYTLSFLAGIVIAYELNRIVVFGARRSAGSMLAVPAIYAIQYLLGLGIVTAAVEWFSVPRHWAPLLSIAATVPITFLLNRWAFAATARPS